MYTKSKEFEGTNQERKEELVRIDSINVMLYYLDTRLDINQYSEKLFVLANLNIFNRNELHQENMKSVRYESYLMFHGKTKDEVEAIKDRANKLIELEF